MTVRKGCRAVRRAEPANASDRCWPGGVIQAVSGACGAMGVDRSGVEAKTCVLHSAVGDPTEVSAQGRADLSPRSAADAVPDADRMISRASANPSRSATPATQTA